MSLVLRDSPILTRGEYRRSENLRPWPKNIFDRFDPNKYCQIFFSSPLPLLRPPAAIKHSSPFPFISFLFRFFFFVLSSRFALSVKGKEHKEEEFASLFPLCGGRRHDDKHARLRKPHFLRNHFISCIMILFYSLVSSHNFLGKRKKLCCRVGFFPLLFWR